MSRTITDLNSQVEELEKRIKAISTSQTTLTQIIAIRDSLEQVKLCLNDLNETIEEKNQIEQDNDITAIKARLTTVEGDISAIETEIATAEDDIESVQSDVSTINTLISEHSSIISNLQTTQTNLQSTQTNLQTTQTNQASLISTNTNNISTNTTNISKNTTDISSLTSRITACEDDINDLTGGIDFGEMSEKLDLLADVSTQIFSFEKYDYNVTVNDKFYTRFYYFTIPKKTTALCSFDFNYTTQNPSGNLTAEFYVNSTLKHTQTIPVVYFPNGYRFEFPLSTNYISNYVRVKLTFTDTITFKTLTFYVHGMNVDIMKYDHEISAITYNNYIYITKHCSDRIYYGKFSPTDTIDFNNLPNVQLNYDNDHKYTWMCFLPYCSYNKSTDTNFTAVYDGILKESADGYKYFNTAPEPSETPVTKQTKSTTYSSSLPCCGRYLYNISLIIKNDVPYFDRMDNNSSQDSFNVSGIGTWTYCSLVQSNFFTLENQIQTLQSMKAVALKNEDGYFYYFKNRTTVLFPTKICKGIRATAFMQSNGYINVYVAKKDGNTDKYTIVIDGNTEQANYMCTIKNCDVVYETLNNKIIKHTPSGWTYETLTYLDS